MVDVAVFMVSVSCIIRCATFMTFYNVSLIRNFAPNGGCLQVKNVDNVSGRVRYFRETKYLGHISQAHSGDHNSFHSTWGYVSVSVAKGRFLHNVGGAVFVGGKLGLVIFLPCIVTLPIIVLR